MPFQPDTLTSRLSLAPVSRACHWLSRVDRVHDIVPRNAEPDCPFFLAGVWTVERLDSHASFLAYSCSRSRKAFVILFQVSSSVSGRIRVSHTTDTKFASATQRGRTCM